MESEFSSAFVPLYADVRVLGHDAVGFPEIPSEVVGEEGLLVVPPPAQLAPPPSKESLRMAACQQMLPSVPLAQRRSLDAWPAGPPEVRDAKPMGSHLDEEIKRRWPQAPLRSNTFRTNNDKVNWLYNNTGPPISAQTSGRASADPHLTSPLHKLQGMTKKMMTKMMMTIEVEIKSRTREGGVRIRLRCCPAARNQRGFTFSVARNRRGFTFSAALCGVGSMVCLKQLNPLQCTRPTDMLF
jgi:hypothetical protein